MYSEALGVLSAPPSPPSSNESMVEVLAIEAAALSRLHRFPEAEAKLAAAAQTCEITPVSSCGDAIRANGVLAVQRGEIETAKKFFEQSLGFARTHNNRFLEASALLNLGLTSLQQEHFDEMADWTDAAYRTSSELGAEEVSQIALGNLGWAYYKLGDLDRSLELSLEAERLAARGGDVIRQLSWITSAGYVYADRGDLASAKQSYSTALELALKINGKEDVYNAQRALALVCLESGDLNAARKYADEALDIARTAQNRADELYPLLVTGLIDARANEGAEAERIFREVDQDKNANASLKWRAEHALAQLYEDQGRPDASDREYRAALATFESARSTLQRNESRLPFSNNASRIYDDYVHFLVALGRTDEALRWADYSRARTLAEGLGLLAKDSSAAPKTLDARAIARRANGTILFYWLGKKQSYLWTLTPQKTVLFTLPSGSEIDAAVQRYRKALVGPQNVLQSNDADGRWLWSTLIAPAKSLLKKDAEVFIIPDGSLNNLNFETLLVSGAASDGPTHFWIEDATIANASSLQLLGAGAAGRATKSDPRQTEGSPQPAAHRQQRCAEQ